MDHEISILIIGMEGIGKNNLAKAIQQEAEMYKIPPLKLITVTSSTIPSAKQLHAGYNLTVILVDQTMKSSLDILNDLKPLRRNFILGKVCYVCFGGKQPFQHEFHFQSLAELVKDYVAPIYYGSKQTPTEWTTLAKSIFSLLLKTSGLNCGFSTIPSSLPSLKPSVPFHFFT